MSQGFAKSIQGPAGATGATGPQGPTGTPGVTGPLGALNAGIATLNFGAAPGGQFASVGVTGVTAIATTSTIMPFIMSESTADNNTIAHQIIPIKPRAGNIIPGVGFTIYAECDWSVTGTIMVRWIWT